MESIHRRWLLLGMPRLTRIVAAILLTFLAGLVRLNSASADPLFAPPVYFDPPVAGPATDVVIGDINRDGKLDLAVTGYDGNAVSVLLGNGDGSFRLGSTVRPGAKPNQMAIGDLNGDGKLDLVVTVDLAVTGGGMSVQLGNGDGTFTARPNLLVGQYETSVAISDLNGDGKADLAAANFWGASVSVLLGNGDGTFGPKTDFMTMPDRNAAFVAAGDINADGVPDLAVSNFTTLDVFGTVSVMLGNGDGSFGARTDIRTAFEPERVMFTDLNGDGKPDLAVVNRMSNLIGVLFGNGDGTFGGQAGSTPLPTGISPQAMVTGDLDGDGNPDVAVANGDETSVSVMLANGHGGFGLKSDYALSPSFFTPGPVVMGDLNGDGRLDLVTASLQFNRIAILLNLGGTPAVTITVAPGAHGRIAPAGAPLGSVSVPLGGTRSFTITPVPGNGVQDVLVDGTSIGAVASYTFSNVTADHSISASFALIAELTLKIEPHELNLNSKAVWITAFLDVAAPNHASQIDAASLRLNGVTIASETDPKIELQDSRLKVKFHRQEILPTLVPGDHVPMVMTGLLAGSPFQVSDEIRVKTPRMNRPAGGETFHPGALVDVDWDLSDGQAGVVDVLVSADGGSSWIPQAIGVPNTGQFSWLVPADLSGTLILAVASTLLYDETGPVNETEFAESQPFSVQTALSVDDHRTEFALWGATRQPAIRELTVSFSLLDGQAATLELFDVGGRLVERQAVGALGAGAHRVRMAADRALPSGLYVIRLTESHRSASARAIVFH